MPVGYTIKEQVAALAGVFQASALVEQLAKTGQMREAQMEPIIRSLFITSPKNVEDVYGGFDNLCDGRNILGAVLERQSQAIQGDTVRYALTLLHLQGKLSKNQKMLDTISQRLECTKAQVEHFSITHDTVIASLADIYLNTISTFKNRVQVTGDLNHLKNPGNANKIRAFLFAGIRSALLWQQTGGTRFQLLLGRKKLLQGLSQF